MIDTIKYETQTATGDILQRLSAPTTQEIVPLDQTNVFQAQEQTEGRQATTVQSFIEGVQIHEVTAHESEKQLPETDMANTKQGTVTFEEYKTSITQETIPSDSTTHMEEGKVTLETMPSIIRTPHEAMVVHETTVQNSEGQLEVYKIPTQRIANLGFEELTVPQVNETIVDSSAGELASLAPALTATLIQKPVEIDFKIPNTTQIIPIDSHGTQDDFTYTKETASEVHDKKQGLSITTSEVQIINQSENFSDQMLDKQVANIVQTFKEHLGVTQVESLVSEDVLQVSKEPESKTATHSLDQALRTTIKSEVHTQDNIGEISHELLEQKQATIKTDTGLLTSIKEHIETQDTISSLQDFKPTQGSASPKHVEHETFITQELTVISQEDVLPDDRKPDIFTAKSSIDSIPTAQATETIVQDFTVDLQAQTSMPEEACVKQSEVPHKLPQSTETQIHECVDTFGDTIPVQDIAQPDFIKLSAPIIQETLIQEQTNTLETPSVPDKQAQPIQSLLENIQITEIISHESEKLLTTDARPDARQADTTYDDALRTPLKSETVTSDTITESMITQPMEETATTTQKMSEALQIHMIETGAKEGEFTINELPNTGNAFKTIDSKLLTAVKQEVVDATHVEEFVTPMVETKILQESFIETQFKIPSAHETIVHESIEQLSEVKPTQDTAVMSFNTVKATVVQESVADESTDGFYELDTVEKIAKLTHDEVQSATVQESIALDSAKEMVRDEKPEQKTAGSTYDMLKSGVNTEVFTSETTDTVEMHKMREETVTELPQIPFEAFTIHTTEVIDKEESLSDFKQPSPAHAQKAVLELNVPEKSQVVTDSHLTELLVEQLREDMVEHISINLGFPTHQSEEVISTESVSELKTETAVEEQAKPDVIKMSAASTADTLIHEEVSELGMKKNFILEFFILKFFLKKYWLIV